MGNINLEKQKKYLMCQCNQGESDVFDINTGEQKSEKNKRPQVARRGRPENFNEELYEDKLPSIIKIQSVAKKIIYKLNFKRQQRSNLKIEENEEKFNMIKKFTTEILQKSLQLVRTSKLNIDKPFEDMHILNSYKEVLSIVNTRKEGLSLPQSFLVGKDNSFLYIGNVDINLSRNGHGILYMDNGEYYEGNWINNSFTGYGRFIGLDGVVTEGIFLI